MSRMTRTAALLAIPLTALLLTSCSASTEEAVGSTTSQSETKATDAAAVESTSWYSEHYPSFATKTFKGRGDDVITLPKGATAGILKAKHTGDANFIVSILDKKNQQTVNSGVNVIGDYKGAVAYGLDEIGSAAKTLKIKADGKWSVTVMDLEKAKRLPSSGHGDGVYRYDGKSRTAKLTHDGDANFIVLEHSDAAFANLQINEIGTYSGKSLIDAGPAIITVQADGSWTVK